MKKVEILDIPMHAKDIPSAVDEVVGTCTSSVRRNLCISATGAHGLVFAKKKERFAQTLQSFHLNLPDGMPGVWIGRLKGAREMKRCYGPDFFEALMKTSASTSITHFLCGGKEGVADRLKTACEEKFGNHNIVGTHCPPFLPIEEVDFAGIAEEINRCNAHVVWIGISTPKQEQFAEALAKHTDVHFLITVGAAFDFHIGMVRQAPKFVQKAGMEWLFRLLMEPKRLYKRYFEIVPLFVIYNVLDLIKNKTQTLKHKLS